MTARSLISFAVLSYVIFGLTCETRAASQPIAIFPNVILIVTDDQRPDTIQALGNDIIRTPNLDRLVNEGTTFTRAIVGVPICVASRAELLTGRDGRLNGENNSGFSPMKSVPHLATVLHENGYETCYVGKWHTTGRPSTHGYETVAGLFGSGGGKFPLTYSEDWKGMPVTGYRGWVFQTDDRQIYPEKGVGLTPNISDEFTSAAIDYLNRRADKPFFLHVNYTAPHDPLFLPEGYQNRYSPEEMKLPGNFREQHPFDHGNAGGRDEVLYSMPRTEEQTLAGLAVYYAVIEHLDAAIGRLLDHLDQSRLTRETIVIFTSDHGLAMGSHGLRGKQNMYEHSIGVPLIVRGPEIQTNRRTSAQCYVRDLYPTICDLTKTPIPKSVQARSLLPVLRDQTEVIHPEVFASFKGSQLMIRSDRWKYIRYPLANREQLFDLKRDPSELHNLIESPSLPDEVNLLVGKLKAWAEYRNIDWSAQ